MSASTKTINFVLLDLAEPLMIRRSSHVVGVDYMTKYEHVIALTKVLPQTNPHTLYQQANIHCACCTGAYGKPGYPRLNVPDHSSWLFLSTHHYIDHDRPANVFVSAAIEKRSHGEIIFTKDYVGMEAI